MGNLSIEKIRMITEGHLQPIYYDIIDQNYECLTLKDTQGCIAVFPYRPDLMLFI